MVVQTVITPRVVALDWLADEEQGEEEESEPTEPSSEEELPQFCSTAASRLRRPEAAPWPGFVSVWAPESTRPIACSLLSAELACRNGTGGPLRC